MIEKKKENKTYWRARGLMRGQTSYFLKILSSCQEIIAWNSNSIDSTVNT